MPYNSVYCDSTLNTAVSTFKNTDSLKNRTEAGFSSPGATIIAHSFTAEKTFIPSPPNYSGNLSLPSLQKSNESPSSHTVVGIESYVLIKRPIKRDKRTVTTTIPLKIAKIDDTKRIFAKTTRLDDGTPINRSKGGQNVIVKDNRVLLNKTESRTIAAESNKPDHSSTIEADYFPDETDKHEYEDITHIRLDSSPTSDIINPELIQNPTVETTNKRESYWNRRRTKICIFILAIIIFSLFTVGVIVFVLFLTGK